MTGPKYTVYLDAEGNATYDFRPFRDLRGAQGYDDGNGNLTSVVMDADHARESHRDAVDPDHYKFPGGVEVRHISAHLTSFGGQAVQYICRATRLDGRNKGNPVEDIDKAITLLQWERDRLTEKGVVI